MAQDFIAMDEREMEQKVIRFAWDRIYRTLANHNTSQKRKDSLSEKIILKVLGRVQIDNRNQLTNAESTIAGLGREQLECLVKAGIQRTLQEGTTRIGEIRQTTNQDEIGANPSNDPESIPNAPDKQGAEVH